MNFLKQKSYWFVVLLLSCSIFFSEAQITITTGPSWKDALLLKSLKPSEAYMATTNYGTYPRIAATAWTHSSQQISYRSLLRFDLTSILPGSTVQSAVLFMNADPAYASGELSNESSSGANAVYFQKVTQAWDASTVTWNSQPATTTTNRITMPASASATGNVQVDLTVLVQDMVNNPASNFGMMMMLQSEVYYRSRNYASTDHSNSALHPKLVITYTTPVIDPLRYTLDGVFANVDKTQVPTGFLDEYATPLVPLDVFNGVLSDSNRLVMNGWRMLYTTFYTSRINGTNPLPTLTSVNTAIATAESSNTAIPVPMLYADYNAIRPDAISANLMRVSNNQLFDIVGRSQSPYLARKVFAASPTRGYSKTGSVSFIFKPELYYAAGSKSLNLIHVDFDNGQGYVNAMWNTIVNGSYATNGTKRIKIRVTFTDATTVECYANFEVSGVQAANRFADPQDLIQSFSSNTNHSGGNAFIRYSRKNAERQITKPLIVVEGYDPSRIAPTINENYSFDDFMDDLDAIQFTYDLSNQLDNVAGYDLIFLDFNNGTDDIIRNAALLQEVITWVNVQKAAAGSAEPNVVMGVSMGGLVARYALANMTKQSLNPQTRLLITHDSPHRGANTPLGLQYLTRLASNVNLAAKLSPTNNVVVLFKDIWATVREADKLLDEPATKQMLILRATNAIGGYETNSFLDNAYRNMITFGGTGPQPAYRTIATSLGSECGTGSLAPGAQLVNIDAGFFLDPLPWIMRHRTKSQITINALPAQGQSKRITFLKIWVEYRILSFININVPLVNYAINSPSNVLPWDGAPGGTQNIASQVGDDIPTVDFSWHGFIELTLNAQLAGDFCFIPTVSALDITTINNTSLSATYSGGTSPTNPARVANFIAQDATNNGTLFNQSHPNFTARNAHWLYNEMEPPATGGNTLNCSATCPIPYGYTVSISGPDIVCSSNAVYTVAYPNTLSGISWTKSTNLNYVSGQGTPNYTVTSNASGAGMITATLTGSCGNVSVSKNLNLGTGAPPTFITVGREDCYDQRFSTDFAGGAAIYDWSVINSTGGITFYPKHNYQLITGFGAGNYTVIVASSCPGPYAVSAGFTVDCSTNPHFAVSPNPASEVLTIAQVSPDSNQKTVTTESLQSFEVSLLDASGKAVIQPAKSKDGAQLDLDIKDLKKGQYILQIIQGSRTSPYHIQIE